MWPRIQKLAGARVRKHAAIAYVTSDRHLRFGRGDVLVTDASDGAIAAGNTSASVLAAAHQRGARVFSFPGLHAKVLCVGRHAIVGSANASQSSAEELVEAAVFSDDPMLLAQTRALIERLVADAERVDRKFLTRIAAIEVRPSRGGARARSRPTDREPHAWLIGVAPLDEDRYEGEAGLAEEGQRVAKEKLDDEDGDVSWVRFTGTSRFRREAQDGDTVIQIWRKHAKAKAARVLFPSPVVHRQDEPTCTRFYIQEFEDEDERAISFTEFARIWAASSEAAVPALRCARLLPGDLAERIKVMWPR